MDHHPLGAMHTSVEYTDDVVNQIPQVHRDRFVGVSLRPLRNEIKLGYNAVLTLEWHSSRDHRPLPSAGTAPPSFNAHPISNPAAFHRYQRAVSECEWSASQPLSQHTAQYHSAPHMELPHVDPGNLLGNMPFPDVLVIPAQRRRRASQPSEDDASALFLSQHSLDPPVRVCAIKPEERDSDGEGDGGTYFITRIGPVPLMPGGMIIANVLPAGPPSGFLVEAMDVGREPSTGQLYSSPPVHMHHSQGYQTHMLPGREVSPGFVDFTPLANMWSADARNGSSLSAGWLRGTWVVPATFPLAVNDLVCADTDELRDIVSGVECAYLKLPPGICIAVKRIHTRHIACPTACSLAPRYKPYPMPCSLAVH